MKTNDTRATTAPTPGPLSLRATGGTRRTIMGDGAVVATTNDGPAASRRNRALADAEEIVRRWNAYPALLAACEWMFDQMAPPIHDGSDGGVESDYARRYADARTALASARGGA